MLVAIGCNVVEGNGASVKFEKDGRWAYFHRPHPQLTPVKALTDELCGCCDKLPMIDRR